MKQQKLQNQKTGKQNPSVKQSRSPNLLKTTAENTFIERYYLEISRGAVVLVILIQILFIGLLIYNSKTVADIENAQNDVRSMGIILYNKRESETQIKEVIKRTARLKVLLSSKRYLEEKVTNIVTKLPGSVVLRSGTIKQGGVSLAVETPTPLEISLLISNYLKSGLAKEIVINSAALSGDEGVFSTQLEVVFQ